MRWELLHSGWLLGSTPDPCFLEDFKLMELEYYQPY